MHCKIFTLQLHLKKGGEDMVNYVDRVLFTLFSCAVAGILMKFLYSGLLSNLYLEHIETISRGLALIDWI